MAKRRIKWQTIPQDHNKWLLEEVRNSFPKYRILESYGNYKLYIQFVDGLGIPVNDLIDHELRTCLGYADLNPLI